MWRDDLCRLRSVGRQDRQAGAFAFHLRGTHAEDVIFWGGVSLLVTGYADMEGERGLFMP